jgi:type I restriction enzyme S subunit
MFSGGELYKGLGKLGTQLNLNTDTIGDIRVPIPSLSEQHAITTFLNRETTQINTLIAKKERLIELLQEKRAALISHAITKGLDAGVKMKDSGVEWLGEIPEHWEVRRLKFVADVLNGVAKGRDLGERDVVELPYLRVANVQDGYLDLSDIATITVGVDEVDRFSLQAGDVLMNEGGDFDKLGRGYVWDGVIAPCLHQNHVFAVRPHVGMNPYWISMITLTSYAKHYFILKSKQSTNLASISATNLKELPILVPPSAECAAILTHIKAKTAKIDVLISRIREGIEKLKEYSTALISAAVTGKIDVGGL